MATTPRLLPTLAGLSLAGLAAYSNLPSPNRKAREEEAMSIQDRTNKAFQQRASEQCYVTHHDFPVSNEETFAGHSAVSLDIGDTTVNHYGLHPDTPFGSLPTSLLFGSRAKTTNSYREEVETEGFEPRQIRIPINRNTALRINTLMNRKRMDVAQNKIVFSIYPNPVLTFVERLLGRKVENCAFSVSDIYAQAGVIKEKEKSKVPMNLAKTLSSKEKQIH